ncbi:oxidoreductase [Lentzea kentuckyensis]|uniref:oxidoreductase n=1 Tax=Lentzea kentuckyensis TaxID=360086 RepID=UPI000A3673D0|nr:oxidoreductase [Lentzea kentuckyensis]
MVTMVPVVLGLLALVDAGFAGFRAAAGRNARIRKRSYHLLAARRGFVGGAIGLGLVALLIVATLGYSADPGARYDELVRAGTRMLQVLAPFAALVVASLLAYWLLPMRESTFVILVGLGPFTLIRPAVVLGATVWSVAGSVDWLVWAVAIGAAVSVLAVEAVVHRRWYRAPV